MLMLTGHETPKNLSRSRTHKIDGFLVKRATAEAQHSRCVEGLAVPQVAELGRDDFLERNLAAEPSKIGHEVVHASHELGRDGRIVVRQIARDDIGPCAAGLFADPGTIGKTVGIASDVLTGAEICEKKVRRWWDSYSPDNIPAWSPLYL